MTKQPSYWCVANIGDRTPMAYGGAFVMVDMRGVYPTELIIFEASGEDRYGDPTSFRRLSIQCDRLTAIKNDGKFVALSDNKYHTDHSVWWGTEKDLPNLASYHGESVNDLVQKFVTSDPVELALAYKCVYEYNGLEVEEHDWVEMTEKEAKAFCKAMERQAVQASTWHDGYLLA